MRISNSLVLIALLTALAGCGKKTNKSEPAMSPAEVPSVPAPEAPSADYDRLKGTWKVIAIEAAGKSIPNEKVAQIQLKYTFDGKSVTTGRPNRPATKGTFALNSKTDPKQMELTLDGTKSKAVYSQDGKQLKLAIGVDENPAAGFPAKIASSPAPKVDLLTLERE